MDSSLPLADQWPEPIVRVQSLSETGSATIPDKYIKPISDRPHLIHGPAPAGSVPVVDLRGLAGSAADREAAVRAMADACKEWGFFQVVNHGVSLQAMDGVKQAWRGFFALPMETKQLYANTPRAYVGYGSRLGVQRDAVLDWGDYYFLHLLPADGCMQSKYMWPSLPPTLREATEAYARELLERVCASVMGALSLGLGLEETSLEESFGGRDRAGACMRVNYYPKCPRPDLALGLSAHSDPGGLTAVLPDHVRGLQVWRGDAWVTVEPVPDALIINVGDQIEMISNGIYKSVEHRVTVNSAEERLSIAFFYNPKGDKEIKPLQGLMRGGDDPPRYRRTMTYDEYRMNMRRNGPRGKGLAESLKPRII